MALPAQLAADNRERENNIYKCLATSVVRGLSIGVHSFITYNNGIRLMYDALKPTTTGTQRQSLGTLLWSPISYTSATISWAIGWNPNVPAQARNAAVGSAAIVVIVSFAEVWIRKNSQQPARNIQLLRLCGRTIQMGAVGYYVGQLNGLVFGVLISLILYPPIIMYKELRGYKTEDVVNEEEPKILGGLMTSAQVLTRAILRLSIQDNLRCYAVLPLAVTMAATWQRKGINCQARRDFDIRTLMGAAEIGMLGVLLGSALSNSFKASLAAGAVCAGIWVAHEFVESWATRGLPQAGEQ